jgi:hypothetical protein
MSNFRAAIPFATCAILFASACDDAPAGGPQRATVGSTAAADLDPRTDDRFAFLLGGCPRSEPFTADTTNLLPTIVAKVGLGESMVSSRARADLIAAGRPAVPELRRAFQRWFSEPGLAPRLLALLELASLAGGPEARAMGLEGLEHPSEAVCTAAARALSTSSLPEDYERIVLRVAHAGAEFAKVAALALLHADAARTVADYPRWVAEPGFAGLLEPLAPHVALALAPQVRAQLARDARVPLSARTWFLAAQAAAGDEAALGALRESAARPMQRAEVVRIALAVGLESDVLPDAARDPDPNVRLLALEVAATRADSPAVRARIAEALADGEASVRGAALDVLCARSDPAGIDRAIDLLGGTNTDLKMAIGALRQPMSRDLGVAERALARLEDLLEGGARSTDFAIERAIGLVPLARAAELLIERGRAASDTIQDLPAHRWYAIQAGNAGAPGRAWIRAQWDVEEAPVRRLDLLAAGVQEKSPEARAFLERVLAADRAVDLERLLAADLLARTAPMVEAAPILKRASLRFADPVLQRAMFCLLWRFYGPES